MRVLFCFLIMMVVANFSLSQEVRPTMMGPLPEQDVVKELLDRVSNCCSQQDFRGFMKCFTPTKASSIRKGAEHSFICNRINMEVLDFFIISAEEESISFGLRYIFSEGESKHLYCSKVVAKKMGDSWRIDSEQVKSATNKSNSSSSSFAERGADRNVQFEIGKEPGRPEWCPPGIGWVPGGCANGMCGPR